MPLRLQLDGPNSPQTYFFKNLHSISHLSSIASQIGPDRTRETLIPYLSNGNEQVSVDVLQEMAIQLPHLIPCVGGLDHAHELFQPFQSLFAFNLNTVRDKAVNSLAQIATQAQGKNSQFVTKFRDFVEKLATSDLDTHRASSCGLFHTAFPNQSPQTEHVQLYSKLCKDKSPLVRRSAVMYFGEFYKIVRMSDMEGMRTNFTLLAHDDQDYVRLFAANVFSHLIKTGFFSLEDVTEIFHTISEFSEDKFWLVRYAVPDIMYKFCEVLGKMKARFILRLKDTLLCLKCLLQDDVEEVRKVTATMVIKLSQDFSGELSALLFFF